MSDTATIRVLDFDCPTCANTVERALAKTDGVTDVEVHYTTGRVVVEYDPSTVDPDSFLTTIENQGFSPQPA